MHGSSPVIPSPLPLDVQSIYNIPSTLIVHLLLSVLPMYIAILQSTRIIEMVLQEFKPPQKARDHLSMPKCAIRAQHALNLSMHAMSTPFKLNPLDLISAWAKMHWA